MFPFVLSLSSESIHLNNETCDIKCSIIALYQVDYFLCLSSHYSLFIYHICDFGTCCTANFFVVNESGHIIMIFVFLLPCIKCCCDLFWFFYSYWWFFRMNLWYYFCPHYFIVPYYFLTCLLFLYNVVFPKSLLSLHGNWCLVTE